jgi:hypothetical protein
MATRIGSLSSLDKLSQVEALLRFATNLTVAAREAYSDGTYEVRQPERLRDINEIMHQVLQHARHVLMDELNRYPDEVLDSIILERATRSGLEKDVDWAWRSATKPCD